MRAPSDQTVLVCGGRYYDDKERVFKVLDQEHARHRIGLLVHGAADGADSLAESWAKKRQVMYLGVPAPWKLLGRAAGPRRNSYMLAKSRPDRVIAFPGDTGTLDMVTKAKKACVTVVEINLDDATSRARVART